MTLNAMISERLLAVGLDPEETERVVRGALDEDLRYGPDVTSAATAAPDARAVASVVARELAGGGSGVFGVFRGFGDFRGGADARGR